LARPLPPHSKTRRRKTKLIISMSYKNAIAEQHQPPPPPRNPCR
jgi:hypothetical protein